ncbi:MAG: LuxR C-terminal-related transcriptional regulator [Erythrobacter sp.]
MQRYFAKLETIDDVGQTIHAACEMISDQGVLRQSYHVTPPFSESTSKDTSIYSRGFSREWMALYEQGDLRSKDPIPERILAHGTMMTWQDAMARGRNTEEHLEYFATMREHGLVHGFGVPLYGMSACDAYSAFDFGRPLDEVPEANLGLVRALAQAGHQRVCMLLNFSQKDYDLSEREKQVLEWLARGKSIWAIAAILDLSPDTVKTYSRRLYAKLEVSDRVGAVVKALRLGLVRI